MLAQFASPLANTFALVDPHRRPSPISLRQSRLTEHSDRYFADQQAWTAHLEKLGIAALKVNPDPLQIATEGALRGSVQAHGFLCDSVIISGA